MTKQEYAIQHIENNYDAIDEEAAYDAFLDEVYPECNVAGLRYQTSRVLAEIDPTAYRCGKNDWLDGEMKDGTLVEIAGEIFEREAAEKLEEITDALEGVEIFYVTGEDLVKERFSHSDFQEKPEPTDYDTRAEYREAVSEWEEEANELEGWHWQNEDGELHGPFDSEEDAWEDAAGV